AEGTAPRLEARDLDAGAVLKDLHLRQIGPRHLQVQRAFVRLEPEFLAELVSVALLAHVERALAEAARQGTRDRQRLFEFEDALIVCVFFPEDFTAAGSETNPLTTGLEVPGDEAVPNQFQNPLRRTLLAHPDQLAELAGGQVHVFLHAAQERDRLQRLDMVRLHGPAREAPPDMPFPGVRDPRPPGGSGTGGRC